MEQFAVWIEHPKLETDIRSLDRLVHPDAELALNFWRSRAADGIRMGRDVPSRSIGRLLSHIAIMKPTADGADFKVHLAGTAIRHRFGRDISGEMLSEIYPDASSFTARLRTLKEAIAGDEPRMVRFAYNSGNVELMRLEVLVLPVVAPNGIDRWALVFAFYF